MNFVITKSEINRNEFIKHLVDLFPEIKGEVIDPDYEGLIHLQVAALARYTNDCIDKKRLDIVIQIFNFFETVINKVDSDTENALYVSFLEHIEFNEFKTSEIKRYLKPEFFNIWTELRNR